MPQLNPKPPKTARSPDDAPNPPCSESSRARCRSRARTARSRQSEAAHDRWAGGSVLTQLGCSVLRETSLHRRKRRCILVVVYISQDSETYPAYRVDTKRAFRARPGPCDSGLDGVAAAATRIASRHRGRYAPRGQNGYVGHRMQRIADASASTRKPTPEYRGYAACAPYSIVKKAGADTLPRLFRAIQGSSTDLSTTEYSVTDPRLQPDP